MASLWTLAALWGLEGIFKLFPWLYVSIKVLGAFYLLYLAWKTFKGSREPLTVGGKVASREFVDGVLLNLSNPKSVFFAAAVLVLVFPPNLDITTKTLIVANHFMVELVFYTGLSLIMTTKTVSKRYLAAKVWFDRFAAVVMTGLGLRLLLQR